MKKNNPRFVVSIWLSVLSCIVLLATSRLGTSAKLLQAGILIAVATLGTWADVTGAGPKMSESSLLRLKVVGGVLAVVFGVVLAIWLRHFQNH